MAGLESLGRRLSNQLLDLLKHFFYLVRNQVFLYCVDTQAKELLFPNLQLPLRWPKTALLKLNPHFRIDSH